MRTFLLDAVLSLPLIGAYSLLGLGITVIYQASRVLNLAHGAMAMTSGYVAFEVITRMHTPLVVGVVVALLWGAVFGLAVERFVVRRLRPAGPTTQTVGTVAVLTASIAVTARIFGTEPVTAPRILPQGTLHLLGGFVPYQQIGIFPVALAGVAVLVGLFQFTDIGLAMRGAAQNRRGAALRGVNPDATAALAWALGGGFAALAGMLLAAANALDPYQLSIGVLPAFVAALIGGLESIPGVLVGAAVIGLAEGVVPALATLPAVGHVFGAQGAAEMVLGVVALVVMMTRGSRLVAGDIRAESL